MNFDFRNFSSGQESQCLPSTFQSHQENEFSRPNPTYHENCSYTQGNSQKSFESLNFRELQPPKMQYQAENIGHISSQINEWRTSYKNHPQALNIQPRVPRPPFARQFSQERCVSKDNFHLNPSIFESGNKEVNYYEDTFHMDHCDGVFNTNFTNTNNSAFSNQYLTNEVHPPFNQPYQEENISVPYFQEFQGNELISKELHQTYDQKNLPIIADPEQFNHIQATSNNQSNQQSMAYINENLFQRQSPYEYPYLQSTKIQNSIFPNQYLATKEHLPISHQCLQEDESNQSPQVYQDNGMNSKELSDALNVQSCVPDSRNSIYTQTSWNKQGFQQSMTLNGANSFCSARKNPTSDEEINRHQVYETKLNFCNNMHLGIDCDNLRDKSHNSVGFNAFECKTDHLNHETFTELTAPGEQKKHKFYGFPTYATTSGKILPLASPGSTHYKNSSDYSVGSWLESNAIHCSNQQYENWFQCNISTNEDEYENVTTSCTDDANILQGYNPLTDWSKEESIFPRNHDLQKNYNEKSSNPDTFDYSQYKNSFSTGQKLTIHPQEHNSESPFKCNYCPRSFKIRNDFIEHIRTHTDERPYRCNICAWSFTQKSHLDIHIRIHTDERPYKCNMCPWRFKQQPHLKHHIRTHRNERPYQCEICHRSFRKSGYLKVHNRTHRNERPYQCSICHNRFTDRWNLKSHIQAHKKELPYQCNI